MGRVSIRRRRTEKIDEQKLNYIERDALDDYKTKIELGITINEVETMLGAEHVSNESLEQYITTEDLRTRLALYELDEAVVTVSKTASYLDLINTENAVEEAELVTALSDYVLYETFEEASSDIDVRFYDEEEMGATLDVFELKVSENIAEMHPTYNLSVTVDAKLEIELEAFVTGDLAEILTEYYTTGNFDELIADFLSTENLQAEVWQGCVD